MTVLLAIPWAAFSLNTLLSPGLFLGIGVAVWATGRAFGLVGLPAHATVDAAAIVLFIIARIVYFYFVISIMLV